MSSANFLDPTCQSLHILLKFNKSLTWGRTGHLVQLSAFYQTLVFIIMLEVLYIEDWKLLGNFICETHNPLLFPLHFPLIPEKRVKKFIYFFRKSRQSLSHFQSAQITPQDVKSQVCRFVQSLFFIVLQIIKKNGCHQFLSGRLIAITTNSRLWQAVRHMLDTAWL